MYLPRAAQGPDQHDDDGGDSNRAASSSLPLVATAIATDSGGTIRAERGAVQAEGGAVQAEGGAVQAEGGSQPAMLPGSYWTSIPPPPSVQMVLEDADRFDFSAARRPLSWCNDGSSTASVTGSVVAYRTINGRRYHSDRGNALYWAANDDQQITSMDLYSDLCYQVLGRVLHKAPLDKSKLKTALDVGTGTGAWAIDFADDNPNCQVVGTDISPIQPVWVPPNLRFEIEDCTQEWTFDHASFDYVHMRLLYGSITDWDGLFDQAYRVCRPGGWIESHEASPGMDCDDGSIKPNSAMAQWGKFYYEGGQKLGRPFEVIQHDLQIKAMRRLGLEDISVFDVKVPIGRWPRDSALNELGHMAQAVLEQDYEGYVSYMAHLNHGWTTGEVSVYCAHLRAEVRDIRNHGYFVMRVVWGRKPERPGGPGEAGGVERAGSAGGDCDGGDMDVDG